MNRLKTTQAVRTRKVARAKKITQKKISTQKTESFSWMNILKTYSTVCLFLVIGMSVISYITILFGTTKTLAEYRQSNNEIHALESKIAEQEIRILASVSGLSQDLASELGFVEAENVVFVSDRFVPGQNLAFAQ